MRSPEETRELWRRLNNPQTIEDWHLVVTLEELEQCPEIMEEVSPFLPRYEDDAVHLKLMNQMLDKMATTLHRIHYETITK